MSIPDVTAAVEEAGLVGLLIVLVVALVRGWIVPGYQVEKIEQDRDEWKSLALRGDRLASRAVGAIGMDQPPGGQP